MSLVFLLSVILKGFGAILEILLQVFITKELGVSGYGTYSTWINAADLIFWILFSGIVKCNTFYLSEKNASIRAFKIKYYSRYVLPILLLGVVASMFASNTYLLCLMILITGLELIVMDQSSSLIARGQAVSSLIGEYVLGRCMLLIGVLLMSMTSNLKIDYLLDLYLVQYLLVIAFFLWRRNRKASYTDISKEVSLRKWGAYQRADIMQSMIMQMPVVVQYFFAGAFEAGVVSIVLLVKKLINFISGPTAKIFLPEFSRLYRTGNAQEIRKIYRSIMRLQMLFVGPLSVVLLGYPTVILKILAGELVEYVSLFVMCSVVFLLTATLGPCGGVMQMTGNEKRDNRYRESALLGMIVVMIVFSGDRLFVLYGLCVQIIIEAVSKFVFVCGWMGKAPVGLKQYISWWIIPVVAIAATWGLSLQNSFAAMIVFAGGVFIAELVLELRNETSVVRHFIKQRKE